MVKYRVIKKRPRAKWLLMSSIWDFLKSLRFKEPIIGQILIEIMNIIYKWLTVREVTDFEKAKLRRFAELLIDEDKKRFLEYLKKIDLSI